MSTSRRRKSGDGNGTSPFAGVSLWTILLFILFAIGAVALVMIAVRQHNAALRRIDEADAKEIESAKPKELPDGTTDGKEGDEQGLSDEKYVTKTELSGAISRLWSKTKRLVTDAVARVKTFAIKCQNEPVPMKMPGRRGRVQSDVNKYLFEHALLYQIAYGGTLHNACKRAFVRVKGGYSSPHGVENYCREHPMDAQTAKESLSTLIVESGLDKKSYYKKHELDNDGILHPIKS